MTLPELRRRRAAAQLLVPGERTARRVRRLLAVQAQDPRAARLALRTRGATAIDESALVTTWLLRGTLHLVAVEDLGWLHGLTGGLARATIERRLAELGAAPERSLRVIERALAGGPLDRAAITARLEAAGLPAEGQIVPHLLGLAASDGTLVLTGDGCALTGDVVAGGRALPDRDAALAELARRYLAGHGPATPDDLAAWSGPPARRARGLRGDRGRPAARRTRPAGAAAAAAVARVRRVPPRLARPRVRGRRRARASGPSGRRDHPRGRARQRAGCRDVEARAWWDRARAVRAAAAAGRRRVEAPGARTAALKKGTKCHGGTRGEFVSDSERNSPRMAVESLPRDAGTPLRASCQCRSSKPSVRDDANPWPRVVHVALRIPHARLVLRLRRRRGVPSADQHLVLAGRQVDGRPPLAPCPAAQVLAQRGLDPEHRRRPTRRRARRGAPRPRRRSRGLRPARRARSRRRPARARRRSRPRSRAASPRPDPVSRPRAGAGRRRAGSSPATVRRGPRSARATSRSGRRCSRGRRRAAARRGPARAARRSSPTRAGPRGGTPCRAGSSRRSAAAAWPRGTGPRRRSRRAQRPRAAPPSARTSVSRTPVHVAVPVAPGPHGASPGMSRIATSPARRLPAHCSVAVTVHARNASRSVESDNDSSRSTSPCTRRRQAPASSSGTVPWPRT